MNKSFLAIDLGASGGRAMVGTLEGENLTIKEINRFWNGPTEINSSLRWDFLQLLAHIKESINLAKSNYNLSSIAIDTWGVDYGLINADGHIIEMPFHYRDSRTEEIFSKAFKVKSRKDIYKQTGIQFMELNTLYQCIAAKESSAYKSAEYLLFSPDLLSYMLTGKKVAERTIASTSQFYNTSTKEWAYDLMDAFDLRKDILPQLVDPGTIVGQYENIDVVAGAGHDTACAFAATPILKNINSAILSSGTWSLFGCELQKPIINSDALEKEFTNECGVQNTIRFLKNINGLWIIQELKRIWEDNGFSYTFSDMVSMAKEAHPYKYFIDPSHQDFFTPGNMEIRILDFCKQTNQGHPKSHQEILRTAFEGLAFLYAKTFRLLKEITKIEFENIYIVGGGCKNNLLNQMTANTTGLPVISGPIEATAIGNILVQMIALNEVKDLNKARKIVRNSFKDEAKTFLPDRNQVHLDSYKKWESICG